MPQTPTAFTVKPERSKHGSQSMDDFRMRMRNAGNDDWEIDAEIDEIEWAQKRMIDNTKSLAENGRFVKGVPPIQRTPIQKMPIARDDADPVSPEEAIENPERIDWRQIPGLEGQWIGLDRESSSEAVARILPGEVKGTWSAVIIDGETVFAEQTFNSPEEAASFCEKAQAKTAPAIPTKQDGPRSKGRGERRTPPVREMARECLEAQRAMRAREREAAAKEREQR